MASARCAQETQPTAPLLVAGFALAGLVIAWVLTRPSAIVLINWDNGVYISGFASGRAGWSSPPWNSHFGVGHQYLFGVWIARAVGGTTIDGFRLVSALFFAGASALLADTTFRLTRARTLAALCTLAWMTAWVMCTTTSCSRTTSSSSLPPPP
ncbi:MAG: hypothetical protein EXR72_14185 [Myxococcales bacterium]|nr:hypothetical protein [Myxococcales bacterium]